MNRKHTGNKNASGCDKYVHYCFHRGSSNRWQILKNDGFKPFFLMGINQKRQVKTVHLSINCRLLVYRTCIPNGIQKGVDFGPFFLLHFLKITS